MRRIDGCLLQFQHDCSASHKSIRPLGRTAQADPHADADTLPQPAAASSLRHLHLAIVDLHRSQHRVTVHLYREPTALPSSSMLAAHTIITSHRTATPRAERHAHPLLHLSRVLPLDCAACGAPKSSVSDVM